MPLISDSAGLDKLLQEVSELAREAGEIVLADIKRPARVMFKGRIDLVTETDLAVEKFLKEGLKPLLPGAAFLA